MLPCHQCAYREEVPGSAHSRCVYAWESSEVTPRGDPHGIRNGWYLFPFNYDPTWGPDSCKMRSETRESNKVMPAHPLADLLSILGGRRL